MKKDLKSNLVLYVLLEGEGRWGKPDRYFWSCYKSFY
jgi:hypothetical protein